MLKEGIRLLIAVALPCLTVWMGILLNNSRLNDLRQDINVRFGEVNRRFDDLTRLMEARFEIQDQKLFRVEHVIGARLKHLEERP